MKCWVDFCLEAILLTVTRMGQKRFNITLDVVEIELAGFTAPLLR